MSGHQLGAGDAERKKQNICLQVAHCPVDEIAEKAQILQ
jgi:hypothetical protein